MEMCWFPGIDDSKSSVFNETGSRSPCMRPRSDPPKMKISKPGKIVAKKKKNNKANWMVSNSANLNRRIKQHTQFGVSASNGSRDMARAKSWLKNKNNEANWMVSNSAKLHSRTKQHTQFGISQVTVPEIWPGQNLGRKKKKNNEANWMVSYSAKLDRRTKQHTQSGVSASNGSRDMARTKSWQKKRKKLKKRKNIEANWMVIYSAKLDCRTKQHTQFGVSASNGSRDMGRTKSRRKKKKKEK